MRYPADIINVFYFSDPQLPIFKTKELYKFQWNGIDYSLNYQKDRKVCFLVMAELQAIIFTYNVGEDGISDNGLSLESLKKLAISDLELNGKEKMKVAYDKLHDSAHEVIRGFEFGEEFVRRHDASPYFIRGLSRWLETVDYSLRKINV